MFNDEKSVEHCRRRVPLAVHVTVSATCRLVAPEDVAQIADVKKTFAQENLVVSWFANHHKPLAILRQKSKTMLGRTYELIKAGATRMGTHTLVGERLAKLKGVLQATVVDPEYVAQNYKDFPDEEENTNCEKIVRQHKAGSAKAAVLDDAGFWEDVNHHIAISKPVFNYFAGMTRALLHWEKFIVDGMR